jgi:beta-glucosidase
VNLDKHEMHSGDTMHASVCVTNTGDRAGTETVQLYIRDVVGSVSRPLRELKGFRKITLQPGESREVVFDITEDMLRFPREQFKDYEFVDKREK